MKQVLQHLKSGELLIENVPVPLLRAGHVLVETRCSLISAGTERMIVDFGRANLLQKALQKPDKVKQVIEKVKTDGLGATLDAVNSRLDQPIALGYSNVGRVIAVGEGVDKFKVGDRVVSNGKHAETVLVPENLCAKIPDDVSDEAAAFTVLSSIALQGVRLVAPTLGEYVCVMGLGLIGLVAVQILKANGCRVIGFDFDKSRVALAQKFGATAYDLSTGVDSVAKALEFTGGQGIDAVLVTAATQSNDVMHHAAQMCRQRGRIVLTGVVGLDLDRNDFYEKEISFQVSCSYGPGRYDEKYEEGGQDYPLGFVRWTEQRNFEAVLHLLGEKAIDIAPLLTMRVPLEKAVEAYDALADKNHIGMLLEYKADLGQAHLSNTVVTRTALPAREEGEAVIGIIGAGGFTAGQVLPALAKTSARLKWIASREGVSGANAARKFGIENNTTDYKRILEDAAVNAVVITTRHGSHAKFVIEALDAGKHVFVEKPLCLNSSELANIRAVHTRACAAFGKELVLMVGFNRRFSPLTDIITDKIHYRTAPLCMVYTANVGHIAPSHWTQDEKDGGGRIIGEACHFIDYLTYLAGESITSVSARGMAKSECHDTASILLTFADGSIGTVNYVASGNRAYPKEQCQIFFDGKILDMQNFRKVRGYGIKGFSSQALWRQDKGHATGFSAFVDAVAKGKGQPIPLEDIFGVTEASFAAWQQITAEQSPEAETVTEIKARKIA